MQSPPKKMQELTQAFSDGVRHADKNQLRSIARYHEFVKGNVLSTITQTFPMFIQQLSEQTLASCLNRFLLKSQAIEPEFHHIATEFVRFLQGEKNPLSRQLISVLEYEWVIFNAEITTDIVTSGVEMQQQDSNVESLSCCTLQLNPTLQLIEVPFYIKNNVIEFNDENEPLQAYAVYRNTAHQVLSHPLGILDRIVLSTFCLDGVITFEALVEAVSASMPVNGVSTWVQYCNHTNLIRIDRVSNVNSDPVT